MDSKWTFPAGSRASLFETRQSIAKRETEEESGIVVDVGEFVCGVRSILFFGFVGHCCTANPTDQEPTVTEGSGEEISDAQYMTKDAIELLSDDQLRFPEQRQLLLDVIDEVYC